MQEKKSILIIVDSYEGLDIKGLKECLEASGRIVVSLELGDKQYSDFSAIIFDVYIWECLDTLKDKLSALLKSRAKLICFPSIYRSLAEDAIKKSLGYLPEDLGWLELRVSKNVDDTIMKLVG